MKRITGSLVILLTMLASVDVGAEPPDVLSGPALAESMRQARYSDGFEARMTVSVSNPDGRRLASFKVSVIGQIGTEKQRLLIRGISPDKVRDRYFAAERSADGRVRSIEFGRPVSDGVSDTDPFAKLFDSGLVLWDMLNPWWNWPKQVLGGTAEVAGRTCTDVHSQAQGGSPRIREVVSCVDRGGSLATRTLLFDSRHELVRTITVNRMMRKDSGLMTAKKMSITSADNSVTEIEIYGGDEHYLIAGDTFAALEFHPATGN